MKRTGDTRRRGLLRSLFLADPYRKLIAVGLAVGLWHYLDSQVSDTYEMDLGLDYVDAGPGIGALGGADPNYLHVQVPRARYTVRGFENALTGAAIQSVKLEFSGPKHLITRLSEEQPAFIAHDPGDEDLDQQGGFEFSVADIRVFLDFQGLIERMTPSRVKVVLERNVDTLISLTTDRIQFEFPSGVDEERALYPDAVFPVTEVDLYGPGEDAPRLIETQKLFRVSLRLRSPEQVGGTLVLLDQFSDFTMEPQSPSVSIPLQPEPVEYRFSAKVMVDDVQLGANAGKYEAEEKEKEFDLMASGPLLNILESRSDEERRQWALEHLRLHVLLPPTFDPTTVNVVPAKPQIYGEPLVDKRHYREKETVVVTIVPKEEVP